MLPHCHWDSDKKIREEKNRKSQTTNHIPIIFPNIPFRFFGTSFAPGAEVCTLGWDTPMRASSFSDFFATLSFSSLLPWGDDAEALTGFALEVEACTLGWATPVRASSFSNFFATLSFSSLLPWDGDTGALP